MVIDETNKLYKQLPAVDKVLAHPCLIDWNDSFETTKAVREVLAGMRIEISRGNEVNPSIEDVARAALLLLETRFAPMLKRVINGTGIVIHTNLGRSPLGESAINAMVKAAKSYSSLEYDLEKGRRGSRHYLVHTLLKTLTGAEDALVTNNNASALLLALTTLSKRKEVLVSRGELVEIGGSFRIPDICKAGGAKLHEVGTTNRTRLVDFKNAISPKSGLLLRVHTSNYRVVGFTEKTPLEDLVTLAHEHELPVVDDLGSGAIYAVQWKEGQEMEPTVFESVSAGVDVVTFSGDKLLGGPQAGIAVGSKKFISKMRKNPLMRAVRPDKLTFAALDATLREYLMGLDVYERLPIYRMINAKEPELLGLGNFLVENLRDAAKSRGFRIELADSDSYTGGGSLPTEKIESKALGFNASGRKLNTLQKKLRELEVPVIGYVKEGIFLIDLRTLLIEDKDEVSRLIKLGLDGVN